MILVFDDCEGVSKHLLGCPVLLHCYKLEFWVVVMVHISTKVFGRDKPHTNIHCLRYGMRTNPQPQECALFKVTVALVSSTNSMSCLGV